MILFMHIYTPPNPPKAVLPGLLLGIGVCTWGGQAVKFNGLGCGLAQNSLID
jgi:hypothetical protein